jgi:signal transduction histidine kinase
VSRPEDGGALLATRIAARTAHDLNNLAAVFSGHLYLLRNGAEPPEEAYEAMEKALAHLDRLTRGLTILGTLGAETPEPLDLNEVARSAARADGQPSLELDLEPGLPDLPLRRADLLQAIEALISNAREASESGAAVRVTTRLDPTGSIRITVEDSGPGIAPEVAPRCLDPFFSTKGEKGRGIGLTVALLVATLHSGTVEVVSRPEGGTRTTLVIPVPAQPGP